MYMCQGLRTQFKKISIPPPKVNGNSKRGGAAKVKVSKEKYEAKFWSFQRGGGGVQTKKTLFFPTLLTIFWKLQ